MDRLQQFEDWVKAGNGNRHIRIDIGDVCYTELTKVWAYDYNLKVGMYVNSVEEIDLVTEKAQQDKIQYETLKAIFEEKSVVNI